MSNLSEKDLKEHAKDVAANANKSEMLKELDRQEHEEKHAKKAPKKKTLAEIRREEGDQLFEGRFRNLESPGSELTFTYNMKKYTLKDGEVTKLPLRVAKHLNNCYYKVHHTRIDGDVKTPHKDIGKKVDRFAFESLVFTPDNKYGPVQRVHEVEYSVR